MKFFQDLKNTIFSKSKTEKADEIKGNLAPKSLPDKVELFTSSDFYCEKTNRWYKDEKDEKN